MKLKPRPPIAEVMWTDAVTSHIGDCMTLKKAKDQDTVIRYSTGYLLLRTKTKTVISSVWDPETTEEESPLVSEVTTIPTPWVQKIILYSPARSRKQKKESP